MSSDPTREVARVFDAWADAGRDEGMASRHGVTAGPVLDGLRLEEGDRFLDLGTGNGWAARYAAGQGARPVGVDASVGMLARAAIKRPRVPVVACDVGALPFRDACFDAAFSMEALYYAGNLIGALGEALRVLRPGGPLHAVIDYYEENPASEGWPEKTGVPMHRLSEEGWRDAFRAAGFEAVGSERVRVEDPRVDAWKAEHGSLHVHGVKP